MPVDALPYEWRDDSDRVTVRREYRDALGRPLRGTVTLTGRTGMKVGDLTVPPVGVTVELVGGVLDVALPPDTYAITGHRLRTADGESVNVTDEVTVA